MSIQVFDICRRNDSSSSDRITTLIFQCCLIRHLGHIIHQLDHLHKRSVRFGSIWIDISNIVQERSINANKSILGGDKTAADINRWASNIIGNASPFDTANLPAAGAYPAAGGIAMRGPNEAYDSGFNVPTGGDTTHPQAP